MANEEKKRKRAERERRAETERLLLRALHSHQVETPDLRPPPHKIITPQMRRFQAYWLRSPADWASKKRRSHNLDRQRHDLIRHLFCNYRVPKFLFAVWSDEAAAGHRVSEDHIIEFPLWFIAAGQGQSLYKTQTKGILTKRETHMFLKAPDHFSVLQNIWWARTLCFSDDLGCAERTARSKLSKFDFLEAFWISVMGFFVHNPTSLHEMNDLIDYVVAARAENPGLSMKGRSLLSLRRRMEEWHRHLAKLKKHEGTRWEARDVPHPVWRITLGKGDSRLTYTVQEITDGRYLALEGRKMRHCVYAYQQRCVDGETSIWTMKKKNAAGVIHRSLTIEVDRLGAIIQARGFANRPPRPQEAAVSRRWAVANGFRWQ